MRTRRGAPAEELNLVPVMNLVTILIPFLLMSAQFVSMAVIDSNLPAISTEPAPPHPHVEPTEVSIVIGADGYAVTTQPPLDLPDVAIGWDTERLTEVLSLVKDRWPDEQAVILVPESGTPYELLIEAMDAARGAPDRTLFPGVVVAGGTG